MLPTARLEFSERHIRAIQRILDQMDRTAQRTDPHYSRVRKFERKSYRGPLSLYLPRGEDDTPPADGDDRCHAAWSYSLSQGGVGLIALAETDKTEAWVGVHLPNHTIRWMFGRIVRQRPVPEEEFFDYGICFTPK